MAKKYSYWIDSGKYSMMQQLAVVFFGTLSFMFLARLLVPDKFGVWNFFIIISSIVETARAALIRNGYIFFINKEQQGRPSVEGAALATNCIFSLILILIFLLSGPLLEDIFHAPDLATILNYYSITLLLLIPFSQKENFLMAKLDFKSIFWMYCIRNGLFMCVSLFIFLVNHNISLPELTIYYGVCVLFGLAPGLFTGKTNEKREFLWDWKTFWDFIHYGKYVFGNNVFSLLFTNTDKFMIGRYISPAATSFYYAGTKVINFADMPSQVLGNVMFPRAAQIVQTGNVTEMKRVYEKTVAATLTFIIPIILIVTLFSKEIIFLLAGKEYLAAAPVLQVMIFYSLFLPFIRQFGNMMDATHRPQWNFFLMMIFVVFNLGTNFFFIQQFGLLGAAYGTLLSYFVLFLTTQVILARLMQISLLNIIRYTFAFYPDYFKLLRSSFSKIFGYKP